MVADRHDHGFGEAAKDGAEFRDPRASGSLPVLCDSVWEEFEGYPPGLWCVRRTQRNSVDVCYR